MNGTEDFTGLYTLFNLLNKTNCTQMNIKVEFTEPYKGLLAFLLDFSNIPFALNIHFCVEFYVKVSRISNHSLVLSDVHWKTIKNVSIIDFGF